MRVFSYLQWLFPVVKCRHLHAKLLSHESSFWYFDLYKERSGWIQLERKSGNHLQSDVSGAQQDSALYKCCDANSAMKV